MSDTALERSVYLLALQRVPGVGPWTAVQAARAFPKVEDLLSAEPAQREAALGRRFAGRLRSLTADEWPAMRDYASSVVQRHRDAGIDVISIDDEGYPQLLALAPWPAAILYVRGDDSLLRRTDTAAVIGTREPTDRGLAIASRISAALAESGIVVVSGLARGIDQAAHQATVDVKGRTIAVLGSAIDKIYPADAKPLANSILGSGGMLISEYPMGFPTTGRHFVERDRIQAGMSVVVIPIQTGVIGGTLHTVRFAAEAGRAVFAPRPPEAEASDKAYGGIEELLKSSRATPIESQADYPALVDYLAAYRDHLVHSTARPRWGDSDPAELGRGDTHDGQQKLDL